MQLVEKKITNRQSLFTAINETSVIHNKKSKYHLLLCEEIACLVVNDQVEIFKQAWQKFIEELVVVVVVVR